MKVTMIPIVIGALGTISQRFIQRKKDLEIRGRVETLQTSIIKIGQNTKKSPGDLEELMVTQTLVKNHQLTMV